jgi:hypothetical protein
MRGLLERRLRRWVMVIACCLAVLAGIALAREFILDDARWLWLLMPFVLLSLRRHNAATLFFLTLLFFGIGWWRGSEYMQKLAVHESLHY